MHRAPKILLLILLGFVAGCDPTIDNEDADDPITTSVETLSIITSSPQISSGGSQSATVTAIVKDSNNQLVEGAIVTFQVNNDGSIQVTDNVTDVSGTIQAEVSTTGTPDNRTITVTAESGDASDSVDIDIVGTSIQVSGSNTTIVGGQIELTFLLQDGDGDPISGRTLAISSSLGNTLSATTVATDSSGAADVTLTASQPGQDTITASGAGANAQFGITVANVSTSEFVFIAPATANRTISLDTPTSVQVHYTDSGIDQVGVEIKFAATRGTLNANSVFTDSSGVATVSIESNNAGPSIVSASVNNGPSTQIEIEFVADTPAEIDVQANPASVGTDGETSTITAVVRDDTGNPVKGQRVLFNLQDITGGQISPPFAITDSLGRASTIYTSSTASSGADDGPLVTATVEGTAIQDSVTLTVAEAELFIVFGTGNDLKDINDTRIEMPYTLIVTDANGGGVANVDVQLSVLPPQFGTAYYKGTWQLVDTSNPPDGTADDWGQIVAASCGNEDQNRNGVLEPGEDTNANGFIEPGNSALVQGSVTTDDTGLADFAVIYPKEFAFWTRVELTARASVSGTESAHTEIFTLRGIADDYDDKDVSPPGQISPFGTANSCANPN